jgi:hypothetical protein
MSISLLSTTGRKDMALLCPKNPSAREAKASKKPPPPPRVQRQVAAAGD